jgi:hypothetical protein
MLPRLIDAVDHLRLPPRLGHARLKLLMQLRVVADRGRHCFRL